MTGEESAPARGIAGIVASVADDLRSSPGLLVVAIVNVVVLAMLFIATRDAINRRDKQFMYVLERCASLPGNK